MARVIGSAPRRGGACALIAATILVVSCGGSEPRPPISHIEITPRWTGARPGGTVRLRATAFRVDGTHDDVTSSGSWSSLEPLVATVGDAGGAKGVVTGVQPGKARIEVVADNARWQGEVTISAIHPVDRTLLTAPDGHVSQPSTAIDEAGRALVAFGIQSPDDRTVLDVALSDSGIPVGWQGWSFADVRYWPGFAPIVAVNDAGAFAVAFPKATREEFGLAYFDGVSWSWFASVSGTSGLTLAMMPDGTLFVGHVLLASADPTAFTVERFDAHGALDATTVSPGGALVQARNGKLMMSNGLGTRTFDGVGWSDPVPFDGEFGRGGPFVKLYESGEADAISTVGPIGHSHFDGNAWSPATSIGPEFGVRETAAAADESGRIAVAWARELGSYDWVVEARIFDGTSWGPTALVGPSAVWDHDVSVRVDAAGRFVVLWDQSGKAPGQGGVAAAYHDGTWHPVGVVSGGGAAWRLEPAMNGDGAIVIVNDCEGINTVSASFLAFEP